MKSPSRWAVGVCIQTSPNLPLFRRHFRYLTHAISRTHTIRIASPAAIKSFLISQAKQDLQTYNSTDYIPRAIPLMAEAFATDPIITYLLHHMTQAQLSAYLPKYFDGLLTAAALNKGIFAEADDFKSCTILMPPGCHVDNPWTLIPAGFVGMVWDVGFAATYVGLRIAISFSSNFRIFGQR